MGRAVQRQGDKNSSGGVIMSGVPTVMVDGKPIAVKGMPVSPHTYQHYGATTTTTQSSVFCNGQPVVATGDPDSCGDTRVGGSTSVFIG